MSSGFQVHQDLPHINALPKPIGSYDGSGPLGPDLFLTQGAIARASVFGDRPALLPLPAGLIAMRFDPGAVSNFSARWNTGDQTSIESDVLVSCRSAALRFWANRRGPVDCRWCWIRNAARFRWSTAQRLPATSAPKCPTFSADSSAPRGRPESSDRGDRRSWRRPSVACFRTW